MSGDRNKNEIDYEHLPSRTYAGCWLALLVVAVVLLVLYAIAYWYFNTHDI